MDEPDDIDEIVLRRAEWRGATLAVAVTLLLAVGQVVGVGSAVSLDRFKVSVAVAAVLLPLFHVALGAFPPRPPRWFRWAVLRGLTTAGTIAVVHLAAAGVRSYGG